MAGIAAAILGGSALAAGASYLGSKKQAGAAQNAANLQQSTFQTLNAQQQPFIQGGYGALGKLNTLLGLNPDPNARVMTPTSSPMVPRFGPITLPFQTPRIPYSPSPASGNPVATPGYPTRPPYQIPSLPYAPQPPNVPYDPGMPPNYLRTGLPGGTFGPTMTPDMFRMIQGSIR